MQQILYSNITSNIINARDIFIIACNTLIIDDSTEVAPGIFWGGNFEMVKMMVIAGQLNSNEIKFIAGYSGWESSQLQNELFNGSWIQASAKPEYIFNNDAFTVFPPENLYK